MMTAIKFAKVRPEAKIPTKRLEDAGYDVYACFDEDYIEIPPHETVMIPTGIASACDTDYCFILKERGSTGTRGIAQRCGVIDSGFRGEWMCPVTNTTDVSVVIKKKDKIYDSEVIPTNADKAVTVYPYEKAICQTLLVPVPETDVEEYTYDELKAIPSQRGEGMVGSSGK